MMGMDRKRLPCDDDNRWLLVVRHGEYRLTCYSASFTPVQARCAVCLAITLAASVFS